MTGSRIPRVTGDPWSTGTSEARIERERVAEAGNLALDAGFDIGVAVLAIVGQAVHDLHDPAGDLTELVLAEPACRAGRSAEANAAGHEGLFRIKGHAVLVCRDVRAAQRRLCRLACHALGAQVGQHQVVVGSAGDDVDPPPS